MAEEDQGQERSEEPTQKRRDDFRKKGQVAQSKEIHTAALLTAALVLWYFHGVDFWHNLGQIATGIWRNAGSLEANPLEITRFAAYLVKKVLQLLTPLFAVMLLVGFFSSFLQIGWLFTWQPMQPDISKFNPIKGLGRLVSPRSLVELLKSLAKVLMVGTVAYVTVAGEFEDALYLVDKTPTQTLAFIGKVALEVLFKSCGVLLLLALLDFLYQRWEMEQKMKMTKQEVKEEHKESEGDPQLKSKIKSLQQDMSRKRMMEEVPSADVVITNPTHLAVVLRYRQEEMDAPRLVAKGADNMAWRIREIAQENEIPIMENVAVAQALYRVDLGEAIPEEMYKAVAEILAYVYSLKEANA